MDLHNCTVKNRLILKIFFNVTMLNRPPLLIFDHFNKKNVYKVIKYALSIVKNVFEMLYLWLIKITLPASL